MKLLRVFPNNRDDYGQTWLPAWYQFYQPDIIIQHFDSWVLGGDAHRLSTLPIIWMSPVDSKPLPPPIKASLEHARHVVAIVLQGGRHRDDLHTPRLRPGGLLPRRQGRGASAHRPARGALHPGKRGHQQGAAEESGERRQGVP